MQLNLLCILICWHKNTKIIRVFCTVMSAWRQKRATSWRLLFSCNVYPIALPSHLIIFLYRYFTIHFFYIKDAIAIEIIILRSNCKIEKSSFIEKIFTYANLCFIVCSYIHTYKWMVIQINFFIQYIANKIIVSSVDYYVMLNCVI